MDLVTRLVRALLLLALLLAVAPLPGVAKKCPWSCHCPQREQLDCQHSGLATVPPASRRQALTVLDFTGNSIDVLGKQTWKDYPWTETLVLKDNDLWEVKSRSLEGLFLLKHLDLSCNEIRSIEEGAFEPVPFLKLLNLSGNGLTQISSGTFQAWHGMQFLQELILSHNPLAVIADAAFFKLPSVSSLDLSATQVTWQTLLLLLQTTLSLETLQVPKDVACCLCQEGPFFESPCRSIQFLCQKLCSTSVPQCDHTGLLQTRGEIMDMEAPRKLNRSPVLSLKTKEPSLGDDRTVTLAVALTQSTEGDVSSLDNSRSNSYPPQHLLGHKGKTSADDVRAKFKKELRKKELHKPKSIKNAKSILPYHPQPARLKHVVEKTPSSWDQQDMEPRLNWHGLNPSDAGGGLYHAYSASITGQRRDEEADPAPRRNYIRKNKWHKMEDRQNWVGRKQLFYQVWRPAAKVHPKPRADQRLNSNLDFLSELSLQRRPAVSSWGQATAEEEHSSRGRHPLISPDTTEEKGSQLLNKPRSLRSPDFVLVPGELVETTLDHHQQLPEPDKGLQTFMAHVERALRMDCRLPQLKQVCAKMVSKTRLLLNVLRERQENQGASDHMDQCRLQEKMIIHMALGKGGKLTRKKLEALMYAITIVVLLSFFIFVFLMLKCVFQKRSRPCDHDCQCSHRRILCLRRLCVELPQRWRRDNQEAQDVEQPWAESSSESCPCPDTVYGACQCRPTFKKSELSWIRRIRRVYEAPK